MNLQEQIEKAWKAGYEYALENAWVQQNDIVEGPALQSDIVKEALSDYINTKALETCF